MKQEKIIDENNLKSCFIKKVIKDNFVYFKQCCLNRREHTQKNQNNRSEN